MFDLEDRVKDIMRNAFKSPDFLLLVFRIYIFIS